MYASLQLAPILFNLRPPPLRRKSQRRNRYQHVDALEPRLVLSAPNIISIDAPTQVDEGAGVAINVTFDCDDTDDTQNMIRWSFDGGVNWEAPSPVYATPQTTVTGYAVDASDEGVKTWAVEITDSEGLVTTASGSVTVNNVDPQFTIDSVPTVIHDGMWAYITASTADFGWNDALTATITWSDGTVEIQSLTSNPTSFSAYHTFDLSSDQTVSVTITVDDADGGSVSKSASILYDDIMHDAEGEAHGQVGGTLSYLIGAKTDLGSISAYEIDLNDDGNYEFYYTVASDEIDPENVAIPWQSGAEYFGGQPGVYGATFRAINTLGATQSGPLSVILAAQNVPLQPAPAPVVGMLQISNTNYDLLMVSDIINGEFGLSTTVNGHDTFIPAGNNATNMTITGPDFQTWANLQPTFGLFWGVHQRFGIHDFTSPNAAAMPYFVQYFKTTRSGYDAATQSWVELTGGNFGLDGTSPEFERPNGYSLQHFTRRNTWMTDAPGMFGGTPIRTTRLIKQGAPPNQKFEMDVVMLLTPAAAKLAIVSSRPGGPNTPTWADLLQRQDYYFQTYIVPPQASLPPAYIRWSFRVQANAQTFVFSWTENPTLIMGVDYDVWGC